MPIKLGFVGAGQMGEALVKGILTAKVAAKKDIFFIEPDDKRAKYVSSEYGIKRAKDLADLAAKVDAIILAVKPQQMEHVITALASHLQDGQIIISIAAGTTSNMMRQWIASVRKIKVPLVRVMPNAPALVGASMTAISNGPDKKAIKLAEQIFAGVGEVIVIDEKHLDTITALSGSGPAYFYYFVESLVEGAVLMGLPRDIAYKVTLETMRGSLAVMESSSEHPHVLIDQVCSPGGTTIEALAAFENGKLRATVMKAIRKAAQRSAELAK